MSIAVSNTQGGIAIVDGDFSALDATIAPQSGDAGAGGNNNVPGWTNVGQFAQIFSPTDTQWNGTPATLDSGRDLLALNNGNIYQNLSGTMTAGTTYNFTIAYGWRLGYSSIRSKLV